jgi:hypothetical protein
MVLHKINGKRVRFAEKFVQASTIVKSKPSGFPQSTKIGNLDVKLPCFYFPDSESPQTHGILKKSYEDVSLVQQQDDQATDEHEEIQRLSARQCIQSSHVSNASCPPFPASFNSFFGEINRVWRLGGCVRCLELNHTGSNCSSPQGVVRVLRRVTNLSFVKAEAGQGFFGGPRCEIASPAQQIKRRVWNIKRQRPTVFLPQIHELQKTPASVRSLQPRSPCPTAAISIPRKLRRRRRWRTLWLILLHSWWRVPEIKDRARPARGRIVINGNPPRRHDEYAIVSLVPPPPAESTS